MSPDMGAKTAAVREARSDKSCSIVFVEAPRSSMKWRRADSAVGVLRICVRRSLIAISSSDAAPTVIFGSSVEFERAGKVRPCGTPTIRGKSEGRLRILVIMEG